VDHRVITSERIDLLGDLPALFDACQVADDDMLGGRQHPPGVIGSLVVASMQGNSVPVVGEQLGRHQTESVGRTGDQYSGHQSSLWRLPLLEQSSSCCTSGYWLHENRATVVGSHLAV
jgi:hypothetical protein